MVWKNAQYSHFMRLFASEKLSLVFRVSGWRKGFPRPAAGAPPELLLSDGRKPVRGLSSQPIFPPPTKNEFVGYSFQLKNKYN